MQTSHSFSILFFALVLLLMPGWAAAQLPDFVDIVKEGSPSVVNISTTQKVKPNKGFPHGSIPGLPEGTPFDDFFRRFFDGERGQGHSDQSLGSGFIVSEDGYILTNHHVVADADEIIVRLSDRRELEATVVGSDKRSDVALLKIDATGLPVVKIGSSKKLQVGEWVLAIGSPFDFDHTVTSGIVSALGRSLPNENYVPFIQTDVAINPGNSGGPLFNMDGEVVGVNAQIYSRTGGFMGLSFAIPIELAMDVADQLKTDGQVSRGWLGVLIQDVTRELAESFGLDKPQGALVSQVLPDSPAQKAGFKVGDVIIEFNGQPIPTSSALPPMVGVTPVNKPVKVKVLREGEFMQLTVTIGELPTEERLAEAESEGVYGGGSGRLKMQVEDLTGVQRDELGISEHGVLVVQLREGPALDSGIREGDVVMMINNVYVKNVNHFKELVSELPAGKSVAVLIQRLDGPVFLAVKMPEE